MGEGQSLSGALTSIVGKILEVNHQAVILGQGDEGSLVGRSILDLNEPDLEKLGQDFANLYTGEMGAGAG